MSDKSPEEKSLTAIVLLILLVIFSGLIYLGYFTDYFKKKQSQTKDRAKHTIENINSTIKDNKDLNQKPPIEIIDFPEIQNN